MLSKSMSAIARFSVGEAMLTVLSSCFDLDDWMCWPNLRTPVSCMGYREHSKCSWMDICIGFKRQKIKCRLTVFPWYQCLKIIDADIGLHWWQFKNAKSLYRWKVFRWKVFRLQAFRSTVCFKHDFTDKCYKMCLLVQQNLDKNWRFSLFLFITYSISFSDNIIFHHSTIKKPNNRDQS